MKHCSSVSWNGCSCTKTLLSRSEDISLCLRANAANGVAMYSQQHHKQHVVHGAELWSWPGVRSLQQHCPCSMPQESAYWYPWAGVREGCPEPSLELRQVRRDSDGAEPDTMGNVDFCKNSPGQACEVSLLCSWRLLLDEVSILQKWSSSLSKKIMHT